jgi:ribose transport system ATP-binding protein
MSDNQNSQTTALRLTNVWKHFDGVAALKDVSLEIKQGEIHALLGENGAGKSTLMGVTAGSLQPDRGAIEVFGNVVEDLNPLKSQELGIAIVYQHPALAPDLTVFENLAIGLPSKILKSDSATRKFVVQQLSEVGLDVSLGSRIRDLNVVEQQLLEIAKALMASPRVLILDEPTAALGARETEMLFSRIRRLSSSGVSVVYITHRLAEVRQICETVTVLRDGEDRGTFPVETTSDQEILKLIVGRELASEFPCKHSGDPSSPVLAAKKLSGDDFFDIDLEVPAGEILGIAGIIGNGQSQLLRAMGGLDRSSGDIVINDEIKRHRNSSAALKNGIVYLSADRLREGLMTSLSVRENTAVSSLKMFSKFGVVSSGSEIKAVRQQADSLALKAASIESNVLSLSGGNQQKVLFMRSQLAQGMKVLLADEPTQGVDVGARAEIYKILRSIAESGVAVVIVSSDNQELSGLCDRVITMSAGQKIAELSGDDVTSQKITQSVVTATSTRHRPGSDAELSRPRSTQRIKTIGRSDYGAPIVLAILVAIVTVFTAIHSPRFLAAFNMNGLLLLIAGLCFVAFGETFVIVTGGIDLSVGPMVGLTAVIGSVYETSTKHLGEVVFGFAAMMVVAAVVGIVNGLLVQSKVFTPVAATLVTYVGLQGVSLAIRPFQAGYISYTLINGIQAGVLNVPYAFIICAVGAVVLDYGLRRRKWGRRLRAVGSEPQAAFRLGINANLTIIRAYMICSLFAALGGIMLMASIGVGDATQGINFTLSSITAVVLGGASVFGGRGSFTGVFIGSLLLEELLNVTVFLNLSQAYQYWFQGFLIFFAVGIYTVARNRRANARIISSQREVLQPTE